MAAVYKAAAPPPVTNPAMTCPDLFSWKLFTEALGDNFLARWATDPDTFPGDRKTVFPWALCIGDATANCCTASRPAEKKLH